MKRTTMPLPLLALILTIIASSSSTTTVLSFTIGSPRRSIVRCNGHHYRQHGPIHNNHRRNHLILEQQQQNIKTTTTTTTTTTTITMTNDSNNNNNNNNNDPFTKQQQIISVTTLTAQPIIWTSLYSVATTGVGLPSGPYGLLGAIEGLSYLIMLWGVGRYVVTTTRPKDDDDDYYYYLWRRRFVSSRVGEVFSCVSLLLGVFVLVIVAWERGCVPNAKPLLDYSGYLPVCVETPGLFGDF